MIADPQGTLWINPTGNPGMATAGTGDVLAGMLGALLGQGYEPSTAARLAVYAHGLAGDVAAAKVGQRAMLAGDVLESLPGAFQQLDAAPVTPPASWEHRWLRGNPRAVSPRRTVQPC